MLMEKENNGRMNRRQFLRATGVASGSIIAAGTATAEATDGERPRVGTSLLTSVNVRFKGAEPTTHRDLALSDVYEPQRSQLFLNRRRGFEEFRDEDAVVRFNDGYTSAGEVGGETTTELPTADSNHAGLPYIWVASPVRLPGTTVETNGDVAHVAYDGTQQRLTVGDGTTFEGPETTVTEETTGESVTVTPEIVVNNHGRVTAFGRKDAQTFPTDSTKGWVQNRLESLERVAPQTDRTVSKHAGMTTVEHQGDY